VESPSVQTQSVTFSPRTIVLPHFGRVSGCVYRTNVRSLDFGHSVRGDEADAGVREQPGGSSDRYA
jgi:hypothetical protein